jgi:hypothetical protein
MTDDGYDNDRIDERVRKLAADHYHPAQGSVPRDAMWANIAAARLAERAARANDAVVPLHARRHLVHWRWAVALAAGLLVGVVLDRAIVGGEHAASPQPLAQRHIVKPATPDSPSAATPIVAPKQDVAAMTPSVHRSAAPPKSQRALAVRTPERTPNRAPVAPDPTADAERSLYQLAARQTLVQAEALLTTYRRAEDGQRDPAAMQQAARWSRDVLSSTRLLLDSPASRDPRLRQLLTDLELVLAQIVQLSGAPLQAGERELIERALHERDLLPRLRSAVPAGATAS